MARDGQTITRLLVKWRRGNREARDELIAAVYPQLKRLASHYLNRPSLRQTLQPTALVHELYIRVLDPNPLTWQDRAHFFAVAAQQLRRILIDHIRAARASKRGGGKARVTLTDAVLQVSPGTDELLALDEALTRLAEHDLRAAQVIELRFFGGLREKEAAEALHISVATLKRDWEFARAWMLAQLSAAANPMAASPVSAGSKRLRKSD
jgi:RNA polymerase sigma factor (TIGR02999 family)